jgi:hypothetical protein
MMVEFGDDFWGQKSDLETAFRVSEKRRDVRKTAETRDNDDTKGNDATKEKVRRLIAKLLRIPTSLDT